MQSSPGEKWATALARAQKNAVLNCFFLCNAFAGSDECMKELEYAETKKFNRCPIFLEPFVDDEHNFDPEGWRCDYDCSTFRVWEANKDVIERATFRLQGVPAFLPVRVLTCAQCASTRDQPCKECTDWSVACSRAPTIVEAAATLGTYIDAAFEQRFGQQSSTPTTASPLPSAPPSRPSFSSASPPPPSTSAASALSGSRSTLTDELSLFLANLHLSAFEAKLRDLGAEVPADLANLDDDDCAGIGMKKLQKKRLEAALAASGGPSDGGGATAAAAPATAAAAAAASVPSYPPPSYAPMPSASASHASSPPTRKYYHGIRAGMKLEAVDRKNRHLACVATIKSVRDDGCLVITFDGWTDTFDYVAEPTSPDLHPVGYCQSVGKTLQKPKGYEGTFEWQSYLQATGASAVPPGALGVTQIRAGMKLEAVDRKNPHLTCVATIKSVNNDGRLVITFDGWTDTFDYVAEPTSPDLHPVGYCQSVGKTLQKPKGYEGTFEWQSYLQATCASAVPPDALGVPR